MVKKLHLLNFFADPEMYCINNGKYMSTHESMFLIWKMLQYLKPQSVLEIGFGAGQTTGLILEATLPTTKIISVDISDQYFEQFRNRFLNNNLTLLHLDSNYLNLTQKFDFIYIDGDHTYNGITNDLNKCLPLLHQNSILCIDDYLFFDDVNQAIKEYLSEKHDFVPFLCGLQSMFFHHRDHNSIEFLDSYVMENTSDIMEFKNIDFSGYTVLMGQILSVALRENIEIFQKTLQFYEH